MRRRNRPDDRGAAAVEFALMLPVLVLFLLGILSYGLFFFQATGAEHASREAARLAAVGRLDPDPALATAEVRSRASSAGIVSAAVCYREENGDAVYSRGDELEVRVVWRPALAFGTITFPWGDVPFVPDADRTETAVTSVERSAGVPQPAVC